MNIAMFSDCYHPVINGVTTAVFNLKKELEGRGHNVLVFAPRVPGHKEKEKNIFRLYSVVFPFQKEHRMTFPFPLKQFREIEKQKVDVIHVHSPFMVGLMGLHISKRKKIPAAFTHHTLWEEYVHYVPVLSPGFARKVAISLDKYVCEKSNAVIAPTSQIKELLVSQGVRANIFVVPTGIILEKFIGGSSELIEEKYNLKDEKLLLYVGRVGKEKGLDFLLEAFAMVLKSFDNVKLFIVGDGPYRKELEGLAEKLNIKKHVLFTGYISQDELKHFFARAYLFVFASQTETQGLVIQEAMAAGIPPVAVSARGVIDCVANNVSGILTSLDRENFAESILKILRDELLRKKLAEGARLEVEKFSSEGMIKKILEIYGAISTR